MLHDTTIAHIEELQARYPQARGALLMALHAAQEEKGFLVKSDFVELGDLFNLDPAEIESVASFYTMYYSRPMGKCLFQLCTNVSCMLEGGYPVLEHLRTTLGIAPGEVTDDGLFGIMEVECLAACDTGPCLQISDREFYPRVTVASVDQIITHFRNGGEHPAPGAEDNPLAWTGEVAYEPLAPLAPEEIRRPAKPEPAKPAGAAPAPKPVTSPAPSIAAAAVDAPIPQQALTAEEEAYARVAAAAKAREEAAKRAVIEERQRMEDLKKSAEEARIAAERAEAERIAAIRRREAEAAAAVKAPPAPTIAPPTEPAPAEAPRIAELHPGGRPVVTRPTRKLIEPGAKIGGAAPPLSSTLRKPEPEPEVAPTQEPSAPAPLQELMPEVKAVEPASEPEVLLAAESQAGAGINPLGEPEPVEPKEKRSDLSLTTSEDLPTWEPENPYLRYLQGDRKGDDTDA